MNRIKRFVSTISRAELIEAIRAHWKETGYEVLFTLFGGLVPLWGGMFLVLLYSKSVSFSDFSQNGEFALYSAAVLAPSLYLIVKDYQTQSFLFRPLFALTSVVGLGLSMIVFAGVTAARTGGPSIVVDQQFLQKATWLLFAISVLLSFLVSVIDKGRFLKDSDLRRLQQARFQDFEQEFDKLEGKQ